MQVLFEWLDIILSKINELCIVPLLNVDKITLCTTLLWEPRREKKRRTDTTRFNTVGCSCSGNQFIGQCHLCGHHEVYRVVNRRGSIVTWSGLFCYTRAVMNFQKKRTRLNTESQSGNVPVITRPITTRGDWTDNVAQLLGRSYRTQCGTVLLNGICDSPGITLFAITLEYPSKIRRTQCV